MTTDEVLGIALGYTDESIAGGGISAGKNCTISSITNITGGHRVTFTWYLDDGTESTGTMDVMDGTDGVSPVIAITDIAGGHKVTITDASGDHDFNVMDGSDGQDGVSPTITVSEITGGHRLTITDASGSATVDVMDGTQGERGEQGEQGEKGEDGYSPTITVKTSTANTYVLTITTADGSYDTPNLKGSGGGGGVGDYDELTGKPKIENHTVESGNQTAASLGLAALTVTDALDTRVTALEENPVNPFQFDTMPEASEHPQEVIEYIGADTATYKRGYFYRSTPTVVSGELTYVWQQQDTQPSNNDYEGVENKPQVNGVTLVGDKTSSDLALQDEMQFATMPTADATLIGKVYQYTGANTASYKKGYFYQCVWDADNSQYIWQNIDVSDNVALANRVTAVETNIGDMSALEVTGVVDLVHAINKVNAKAGITRYEYTEPNLIIYYNDGSTFQISVSSILNETQIGELANVIDSTITDGQVLQYDAALQQYKPYAILLALQNCLQSAKDYTDAEISSAIVAGAYVCDEKPTYDADNDTVIYKQNGVTKTTTQTDARFYYYSDGDPFCTSWIDDIEFTFSVADVDFEDYVNKNSDVVSTYTEDMLDKTKIPDVAALDALLAIVKTSLALKVNTSDIIDTLTSSDATKPLSAKQGKVLKDTVDLKNEIFQYSTMPVADQPYLGKVAQYIGTTGAAYTKGVNYVCKYDSTDEIYYWDAVAQPAETGSIADGETKPPTGDATYDALALKQDKALTAPIEGQFTTEDALSALSSNKQAKTLSSTIEGATTVEGALSALSLKTVEVDNATILKSSVGVLSAAPATNNSLGVVTDGDGTSIGANGEVNVVDRLEETTTLPTASATNEGKIYLLTSNQTGYEKGGVYECQETSTDVYEWVLISTSPLTFNSDDFDVVDDEVSLDASQKIKTFTQAGWDALSSAEKIALAGQNVIITDDEGTQTFEDIIPSDASASNQLATESDFILETYTSPVITMEPLTYGEFNTNIAQTKSGYSIVNMFTEHTTADAILTTVHFRNSVVRCTYYNVASISQDVSITVKVLWRKN